MGYNFKVNAHDINGKCSRCDGKGSSKWWVESYGICYGCFGHGSVEKYNIFSAKQKQKELKRAVESRKAELIAWYKKIEEYKAKGKTESPIYKDNCRRANEAWKFLAQNGIKLTIAQIEAMVAEEKG